MNRSVSLLVAGALTLASPLSAFAATATTTVKGDLTTQDILKAVEPVADPATGVAVPMPISAVDGRGGGDMKSSLYYPGPNTGGVQVQADVTETVTPDYVAINAYCEIGKTATRQGVRDALQQIYTDIKNFVGKDGRVRKSGPVSAYPYYDSMTGSSTDSFNGTLNVMIRLVNRSRAQAISDFIEQKNCSVNWDVRLVNTQTHELSILDKLAVQLNARKAVFEKLLGKKLTLISGASLSTWVDSYGSYDPDENTVDATTSLNVIFDLGGRTTLPQTTPMTK